MQNIEGVGDQRKQMEQKEDRLGKDYALQGSVSFFFFFKWIIFNVIKLLSIYLRWSLIMEQEGKRIYSLNLRSSMNLRYPCLKSLKEIFGLIHSIFIYQ